MAVQWWLVSSMQHTIYASNAKAARARTIGHCQEQLYSMSVQMYHQSYVGGIVAIEQYR